MSAASDFARLQRLPPAEAMAFMDGRQLSAETYHWHDLWREEHQRAFTVSRLARGDLLEALQSSLAKSVAGDLSRRDWIKSTEQLLKNAGWWGTTEVTDPRTGELLKTRFNHARLQLIFDTNVRQAAAAGQWQRMLRNQRTHPFARYVATVVLIVVISAWLTSSLHIWFGWNDKSIADKLVTLKNVSRKYSQKKSNKDPKTEKLLSSVMDESKSGKLNALLKKFVIDHNALNDIKIYNSIKEVHAKTIPDIRQDEFIRSMLGYVISPTTVNNNWQVTYENFTQEVNLLAQSLIDTTTQFPTKLNLKDIKHEEYNENDFVNKIRQIEYEEVVLEAVTEYVQTKEVIITEIRTSKKISESLNEYEESLHKRHKTEYRRACRNCTDTQKITPSQNFYDGMMSSEEGSFYIYNSVPRYFHNGMLHILAEENEDFIWLLES